MKPMLEFKNITKRFSGIHALSDVSLSVYPGEIHALVGENGAGKSTLIKTCTGAVVPTSGEILVDGKAFEFMTPILSKENGIGVIYQEFNLINDLTVAENIFLGEPIRKGWLIDKNRMIEESKKIFRKLKLDIDPNAYVKGLSVGFKQIVEIAKALVRETRILIMDEPSAPLTVTEVEYLFDIVKELKDNGVTIIYISHRLDEVFRIADRVTVLRDGQLISTRHTKDTDRETLIKDMVGRALKETFPQRDAKNENEVVFEAKNLTGNGVFNISFKLKSSEILGFGGLVGAGRTELAQLIFGVRKTSGGNMYLNGDEYHPKAPSFAAAKGIALVPEDRKKEGVLLHMSIRDNISIPSLKRISKYFVINSTKRNQLVEGIQKSIRIKASGTSQLVSALSGGNQQKVVLAKEMAFEPNLIIFDEPTRGIDVGAKQEIYMLMNELVQKGNAIIMISSEMEELLGMSDRIIVLNEGRVTGELRKEEFDQELILQYASMKSNEV